MGKMTSQETAGDRVRSQETAGDRRKKSKEMLAWKRQKSEGKRKIGSAQAGQDGSDENSPGPDLFL